MMVDSSYKTQTKSEYFLYFMVLFQYLYLQWSIKLSCNYYSLMKIICTPAKDVLSLAVHIYHEIHTINVS